jgi:hypothetical protein
MVAGRPARDSDKDRQAAARAGIGRFAWARDFFGW